MEVLPQFKDSIRYELSKKKIDSHFIQWLGFPSTAQLVQKLIEDCKLPNPTITPPIAIFSNRLSNPSSPNPGSPKRSSLTPPLSPPAYDRLSVTHSHSLPADSIIQSRTMPSFAQPFKPNFKLPQFYYPTGRPLDPSQTDRNNKIIASCFIKDHLKLSEFENITSQLCGIPKFLNSKLFSAAGGVDIINKLQFIKYWKSDLENKTPLERFFHLLKRQNKNYLDRDDFKPIMKVLMEIHPGLDFLKATPEFQDRYADTVIERIFYKIDANDDGKITFRELKRSNFFDICLSVDEEEDINKIRDYFSYEHFYVLYCRFWEIDTDHDFIIDKDDFSRYEGHTLSRKANDRIFAQAGRAFTSTQPDKMAYEDFIWFMLSEEDKSTKRSLEYWFKIVDLDNNGIITAYEMEYFYEEQLRRLEYLNQEVVPFKDILCQLSDMICPPIENQFTLNDIYSKSKISGVFFNALLNLNKFISYEQRDPFSMKKEISENPDFNDWDRFALTEYVKLAMEEENAESTEVLDEEWDSDHD
jgi:serine/threonine-protein phosphatase 2A regulatory subunit B''